MSLRGMVAISITFDTIYARKHELARLMWD